MTFTERVFVRSLPGGGFVAIDVTSSKPVFGPASCHGAIVLERRAHPRDGEHPLLIAEANGATTTAVLSQLIPTATSNAAVAAAAMHRTHGGSHEPSRDTATSDASPS